MNLIFYTHAHQPLHRGVGLLSQDHCQLWVSPAERDSHQIAVVVVYSVATDIQACCLFVGKVGNEGSEALHVVVSVFASGGEARVSPTGGLGRFLQDEHTCSSLTGGEGSAQGGVTGTDHDDVKNLRFQCYLLF